MSVFERTPDTYQTAGLEQGTATQLLRTTGQPPLDGRWVVNWPKQHRDNGATKQQLTGDRYKQTVRTVKNARRVLAEKGVITRDVAPSYFVECLLYNVPNPSYTGTISTTYVEVLKALHSMRGSLSGLKCQNGNVLLFGSTPEQWDVARAQRLIDALVKQWNDWS